MADLAGEKEREKKSQEKREADWPLADGSRRRVPHFFSFTIFHRTAETSFWERERDMWVILFFISFFFRCCCCLFVQYISSSSHCFSIYFFANWLRKQQKEDKPAKSGMLFLKEFLERMSFKNKWRRNEKRWVSRLTPVESFDLHWLSQIIVGVSVFPFDAVGWL